jgi:hypothetical protein
MKHVGLSVRATIFCLVAVLGSLAFPTLCTADDGATYLVTINDAAGAFVERGAITLHADRTMSVIVSGQGGPSFFFTSQLGSWKRDGQGGLVARTLTFGLPPNSAVARLDYTMRTFSADATHVTGTITVRAYPLQDDPLDGDGRILGTFPFTGTFVAP